MTAKGSLCFLYRFFFFALSKSRLRSSAPIALCQQMCDAARELHDSKTCRVAATYVNGRLVPLNRPLRVRREREKQIAVATAFFPLILPPSPYSSNRLLTSICTGCHLPACQLTPLHALLLSPAPTRTNPLPPSCRHPAYPRPHPRLFIMPCSPPPGPRPPPITPP